MQLSSHTINLLLHFLGSGNMGKYSALWFCIVPPFGRANTATIELNIFPYCPPSHAIIYIYQSAVGSLLYLSIRTRPDIAFAVNNVARFCSSPTTQHWTAVKHIFRYLRETQLGLLYSKGESDALIGYSDADWGGDCNDYKSTYGYIFQIGGTAVSWKK